MSIFDLAQQHLGQEQIAQISQQIGASPTQTQSAVQAALPMMVGGMASTAQQPEGAAALSEAMGSHAGLLGGLGGLGALGGLLGGGGAADGGLLGRVLGGHQQTVQNGVEQASGLDSDQTRKLLMLLAPIVIAMLAKRHANTPHDELGGALGQEATQAREQAQRTSPHVGGILGKILDAAQGAR